MKLIKKSPPKEQDENLRLLQFFPKGSKKVHKNGKLNPSK